jgi:hypothetical protein
MAQISCQRKYLDQHNRTAIFTTSDIVQTWKGNDCQKEIPINMNGETRTVWSRGKLEMAIALNYKIFVASTRTEFGNHDNWWREQIGNENIFFADAPKIHWTEETDYERNLRISSGWLKLFVRLGEQWPQVVDLDRSQPRPIFWTAARHTLKDRGYVLGSDF